MHIKKTKEIIKACRYCLMCKHVCPSGSYSYFESDYPRGRALIMDRVLEGKQAYSQDMIDALYNCFLCGSCHAHCEGNWDLPQAIKAARGDIIANNPPQRAQQIKQSIEKHGHPFLDQELKPLEIDSSQPCALVYIMGPHIRFKHSSIAKAAKAIIQAAGDCFSVLEDEPDCGAVLDLLGYRNQAEKAGKLLFETIQQKGPKTVVVSDPLVYWCLKNLFPAWGFGLPGNISLEHLSTYVLKKIQAGKLNLKKYDKRVTLIDSEYLCRFSGLCTEPREVLVAACGDNFVEMRHHQNQMLPTGEAAFMFNGGKAHGGVMGKRIAEEAVVAGAHTAVTLSAAAKENIEDSFSGEVVEFGVFVQQLVE